MKRLTLVSFKWKRSDLQLPTHRIKQICSSFSNKYLFLNKALPFPCGENLVLGATRCCELQVSGEAWINIGAYQTCTAELYSWCVAAVTLNTVKVGKTDCSCKLFCHLRYGVSVTDTTSNSCEGIVHMFLYSIKCRVPHSSSLVWLRLSTDKAIPFPFGDKIFIRMCKLFQDLLYIKLPECLLQKWKVGFWETFK